MVKGCLTCKKSRTKKRRVPKVKRTNVLGVFSAKEPKLKRTSEM